MPTRTMVYIDGFNLYFGMRDKGWKRYYWMDIGRFGRRVATGHCEVVGVKYFTARVARPPDQVQRQGVFLEANQTVGGCEMYFGRYQEDPYECRHCKTKSFASHEKATDVFLAVELLTDAVNDTFDRAILVSADADYTPVVRRVKELFPKKVLIIGEPPERASSELRRVANASFHISEEILRHSQLPEVVSKSDGFVLQRPPRWCKNVSPRP
jgi:uncharacterized LabA/DUF88 family protein